MLQNARHCAQVKVVWQEPARGKHLPGRIWPLKFFSPSHLQALGVFAGKAGLGLEDGLCTRGNLP